MYLFLSCMWSRGWLKVMMHKQLWSLLSLCLSLDDVLASQDIPGRCAILKMSGRCHG